LFQRKSAASASGEAERRIAGSADARRHLARQRGAGIRILGDLMLRYRAMKKRTAHENPYRAPLYVCPSKGKGMSR
jgi:hypothetical protein